MTAALKIHNVRTIAISITVSNEISSAWGARTSCSVEIQTFLITHFPPRVENNPSDTEKQDRQKDALKIQRAVNNHPLYTVDYGSSESSSIFSDSDEDSDRRPQNAQ